MNKNIPAFLLTSTMLAYSLLVFFKNLDHPESWKFYSALAGLIIFTAFFGLLVKTARKKPD